METLECPKCPGELLPKTYGRKIQVHRCSNCGDWKNSIKESLLPRRTAPSVFKLVRHRVAG